MKKGKNRHLVFTYGTLLRGQWNNARLETGDFIGSAVTVKRYHMTANGVPYVSERKDEVQIQGELYLIDDETFERTDRLEGHPRWYCRKKIQVVNKDTNEVVMAWCYLNERTRGEHHIPSGDFRVYRQSSASEEKLWNHYGGRKGTEQARKKVKRAPKPKRLVEFYKGEIVNEQYRHSDKDCWWCGETVGNTTYDAEMHDSCYFKSMAQ